MGLDETFASRVQNETARFSLAWMILANLVGILLALLLLRPEWGSYLGSLSYGRWMPLHMEWQLYGWCTLPLIGLLMREYMFSSRNRSAEMRFILVVWSIGLFGGGVFFLSGVASGKLFLSWQGWARAFFPLCLCLIWSVLATNWLGQHGNAQVPRWRFRLRGLFLVVLATVPFALYFSASRSVYPPVNPQSGGATGHSLLASSLGILCLFGLTPLALDLKPLPSRWIGGYWMALAGCLILYLLIQHGSVANLETDQIAGLGVLILMIPFLVQYLRSWTWPAGAIPWLAVFLLWWGVLTIDGWLTFLPGVLDQLKFTNGMVAHAHMAMAGMITAFNFLILTALNPGEGQRRAVFGGWVPFVAWNTGCLAMVAALMIQGIREGGDPGVLFSPNTHTNLIYHLRLYSGAIMLAASISWFWKSLKHTL